MITRSNLINEWQNRGVEEDVDYAILTNEIYKSGFGFDAQEYKKEKGLAVSSNLRDSMNNIELALTNLGETTAIELHKENHSQGIKSLKEDVHVAGKVISVAKQEIETNFKDKIFYKED